MLGKSIVISSLLLCGAMCFAQNTSYDGFYSPWKMEGREKIITTRNIAKSVTVKDPDGTLLIEAVEAGNKGRIKTLLKNNSYSSEQYVEAISKTEVADIANTLYANAIESIVKNAPNRTISESYMIFAHDTPTLVPAQIAYKIEGKEYVVSGHYGKDKVYNAAKGVFDNLLKEKNIQLPVKSKFDWEKFLIMVSEGFTSTPPSK
ncbi:MAG: hypothetical protein LBG46_00070 [Elusimicrobiota bacterium]|jgi:hypothetical protein|nr:hypothetical protein [Elusimicrobiota bacterium]